MLGFIDTLVNFVSGLGSAKDKTTYSQYVYNAMTYDQLIAAYRGDWISRKVIDIPAADSTRAWRAWQAEKDDITALEEAERQFNIQQRVKQAVIRGRLFGGGALILGVDDGDQTKPLIPERVRQGSLKWVHVVNRQEIIAGTVITDVTSPWYGEPSVYQRTTTDSGTISLHPSRVIQFKGAELPDMFLTGYDTWGDSVLQVVDDAVRSAGVVAGGIAVLVQEAKVDVIKIPELSTKIVNKQYSDALVKRFTLANQAKSIVNALVLDKEEEWQRISQNFASLPDLLKMYLLIASGAADIPATRMLGQSPQGLSATGESDIRNYYDRISSEQNIDLRPALVRLDEVLIRSSLGGRPDGIYYDWNPLWQLTDNEKAEIAAKKATVFTADVNAGLIPEQALAEARINQLNEDGTYPGLDEIMKDYDLAAEFDEDDPEEVDPEDPNDPNIDPDVDPNDPEADPEGEPDDGEELDPNSPEGRLANLRKARMVQKQQMRQEQEGEQRNQRSTSRTRRRARRVDAANRTIRKQRAKLLADARPRTLYVRRDVLNGQDILDWLTTQGIQPDNLPKLEDLHVTIAFSKAAVDWVKVSDVDTWRQEDNGTMRIPPGGMRMIDVLGVNASVLHFACSALSWRHADILQCGASWDFPEYQPHITLAYDRVAQYSAIKEPYRGEIVLGPEIWKELNTSNDPTNQDD